MINLFRKYKEKRLIFDKSKNFNCWLDLAENEVVMNYLKSKLEMKNQEIEDLILLDKDKKDLKKAKLLGGIQQIIQIIQKADQALSLKSKQHYIKQE